MATRKRKNEDTKPSSKAPKKKTKWDDCRAILLADLESGVLEVDVPAAQDAWEQQYSMMEDFAGVSYKQFEPRLRKVRNDFQKAKEKAAKAKKEYKWDKSIARAILIEDLESGALDVYFPTAFMGKQF